FRGLNRLRHAAPQERVSLWRDGWRDDGAFGDRRRTVALPQLHQPVHAAVAAPGTARRVSADNGRPWLSARAFRLRRTPAQGFMSPRFSQPKALRAQGFVSQRLEKTR